MIRSLTVYDCSAFIILYFPLPPFLVIEPNVSPVAAAKAQPLLSNIWGALLRLRARIGRFLFFLIQ